MANVRQRGEIAVAMIKAAWPPAPVRDVCARAQVGWQAGARTASRLVDAGELVVLGTLPPTPGRAGRPAAVVAARAALQAQGEPPRSFWDL